MGNLVKCCFVLPKKIAWSESNCVESFVGSGTLVTQAKVSLQKSSLAVQLLKIKDQYECLVKFIEKMESAKYRLPLKK